MCSRQPLLTFLLILATFWLNFYFVSATFSSASKMNSKPNMSNASGILRQSGRVKTQPRGNLSVLTQLNFPSLSTKSIMKSHNPMASGFTHHFQMLLKKQQGKDLIVTKAKANSAPDESDSSDLEEWDPPGFGIGWQFPNQWFNSRRNQLKKWNDGEVTNEFDDEDKGGHEKFFPDLNVILSNIQKVRVVARRAVPILHKFLQRMRSGVTSAEIAYQEHRELMHEDFANLNDILDLLLFYGDFNKNERIVNKHATDAAFAHVILYLLNQNKILCSEAMKLQRENIEENENGIKMNDELEKRRLKVTKDMLNYLYWPNFVKQVEWLNWHNLGGQNFEENLQKMAEIFENALKFYEIDLLWDELERNQEVLKNIEQTKNRLKATEKFLINLAKILNAADELSREKRGKITVEMFKDLLESIGHCF